MRKNWFFLHDFISFLQYSLMDENKYQNIYNAMNNNYSYQTYYINSMDNYSNYTISQEKFNSIKDDLHKYINK
jgi:hypothetical protein